MIPRLKALISPTLWLFLWLYLYLVAVLGVWVLVAWGATGWQPTTVTSGSMAPTIRTGDVVFVAEAEEDLVAQRTIVLFTDDEGEQILHRVFAVTDAGYVTKGDANVDPDVQPVSIDRVDGIGRLVVPLVGLPIAWWQRGEHLAIGAWLILTFGTAFVGFARTTGWRSFQRNARRPGSEITQKAVRQVRMLVAVMILSQFLIDSSRFEVGFAPIPPYVVLGVSLGLLAATNTLSSKVASQGDTQWNERWSAAELAIDTMLVIGVTTTTGTTGIGWVLFALPIIEAAARFRLAGALTHWMILTGTTIAIRVTIGARGKESSVTLMDDLDRLVDQLSVLLLVVIPGAYLAEQLVTDVLRQRHATSAAEYRGQILERVATLGKEVSHIERDLFDTLTKGITTLGIDTADVVTSTPDGGWTVLSRSYRSDAIGRGVTAALPVPGQPGSGLRPDDMELAAVEVDRDDPDEADRHAMRTSPFSSMIRLSVDGPKGTTIAVRAGTTAAAKIDPEIVDALQLLLAQGMVGMENNNLVDELRQLHDRVRIQATEDALTGLPNRRLLLERVDEITARRADNEAEFADECAKTSLLFLDLNGFKPVNDRFGHEAGDELLVAVARRLLNVVGDRGMVARIGGDEFTILLPHEHEHAVEHIIDDVVETIGDSFALSDATVSISTSLGVAQLHDCEHSEEFIRRADVAMYRAKNDPTVHWKRYEESMDIAARRAAELAPYLAAAIENDDLTLHFQPLVSARTRKIAGVEALLRWTSAEFGAVRPDELVNVAETNGLHDQLNLWILERAAATVADWQRLFEIPDLFLTVNASPKELQSRQLASNVSRALLLSGLDPTALIVEISERVATEPDVNMARSLEQLSSLGVRVVLDDFGQAQTSLAHLRQLPLIGIKLDRQLVVQAAERREDLVILNSMVSLAHDLSLRVVAEGVETEEQFGVVADAGVDLIQGYLVGRPVPAEDLRAQFFSGEVELVDEELLREMGAN